MSNPLKGEITFTADGENYTLAFTINALCALEERLGIGVSEIGEKLGGKVSIGTLRAVFWAGLLAHHDLSEEAAGDIITSVGAARAGELIGQGFAAAFPEAGKSTGRPRKAAAGTGGRS